MEIDFSKENHSETDKPSRDVCAIYTGVSEKMRTESTTDPQMEEPSPLAMATSWLWNHRKTVATVVAGMVILALLFWLRDLVYLLLTLATALLVPAFLAGLVYGRGSEKAFCIGGLSASTMVALLLGSNLQQLTINPVLLWPMVWGWIVLSGGVSLAVQNYLSRRHSNTRHK